MPQIIDVQSDQSCSLPEAIEALAALDFDPRDQVSTHEAARHLRLLTNNRSFLGEISVDRLVGRTTGEVESNYGPQAIVLSPLRGRMFLRANIWPGEQDLCFRNSGAKTFVYGIPHDHNSRSLRVAISGRVMRAITTNTTTRASADLWVRRLAFALLSAAHCMKAS